jgi:Skp family chaperone for outer membrane proteins
VGLIFLVINLSTSPHEKYIQKSISATNEVAAIIEGITTVEDAQAAAQELAALVTEMRDATSEYRKGERPTLDESRNLQAKYREETRAAQTRLRQASQKLSPRLRSVMGPTVLRF